MKKSTFYHKGHFVCDCGKEFDNSQSFNAHKAHCKIFLGEDRYRQRIEKDRQSRLAVISKQKAEKEFQNNLNLEKWISEKHTCEKCGKIMLEKYGSGRFCSKACAKSHIHDDILRSEKNIAVRKCSICGKKLSIATKGRLCLHCKRSNSLSNRYADYLKDNEIMYGKPNIAKYKSYFLEEQDHKCAICGMSDSWNNKHLVFILDHIDGNADNNNRNNLRLVCPNCDSQLDTYKSKNKNSARAKWHKK